MAGISIKYDAKKAIELVNKATGRLDKTNTIMDVIATMAWRNVIKHFRDEEGKGGKPWAPLKNNPRVFWPPGKTEPRTRGGTKVLQDTGLLRNSLMPRVKKNEAHVFTKVKYAATHQFGKRIPARTSSGKKMKFVIGGKKIFTDKAKGFKMPKRDFLWLEPKKINEMARKFISWVVTGRK